MPNRFRVRQPDCEVPQRLYLRQMAVAYRFPDAGG